MALVSAEVKVIYHSLGTEQERRQEAGKKAHEGLGGC